MSRYRFIAAEKAHYSVAQLCRVLRVAPSGYYAWQHRRPSPRSQANAALTEQIRAVHDRSRCTYAVAESFFATLKTELIHRHVWPTRRQAQLAIFEFIAGWYNQHRRHSALGFLSPAEVERRTSPATRAA